MLFVGTVLFVLAFIEIGKESSSAYVFYFYKKIGGYFFIAAGIVFAISLKDYIPQDILEVSNKIAIIVVIASLILFFIFFTVSRSWMPKIIRHYYANVFGYFWLPCPICGDYFGGHEAKAVDFVEIEDPLGGKNYKVGICPNKICQEEAREKEKIIVKPHNNYIYYIKVKNLS